MGETLERQWCRTGKQKFERHQYKKAKKNRIGKYEKGV